MQRASLGTSRYGRRGGPGCEKSCAGLAASGCATPAGRLTPPTHRHAPVTGRRPSPPSVLNAHPTKVDWEAILSQHPDAFTQRLAQWFLPDAVREALGGPPAAAAAAAAAAPAVSAAPGGGGAEGGGSGGGGGGPQAAGAQAPGAPPPLADLPRASEVLSTMRRRIEALNGPDAPRLAF
jgi:hypothetical protein